MTVNSPLSGVNMIYYVSTSGSDATGNGTFTLPFASLSKAIQTASGGDGIMVLAGTYRLTPMNNTTYDQPGIFDLGKKLTIVGENNQTVLQFYGSDVSSTYRDAPLISLGNTGSIISNLRLQYTPNRSGNYSNAIFRWALGTIKNCFFEILGSNSWSYNYDNDATSANRRPIVENCIFKANVAAQASFSGYPKYNNCLFSHTPASHSSGSAQNTYGLIRAIYQADYDYSMEITTDINNVGDPAILNPDGSRSNIGVRGGQYAWIDAAAQSLFDSHIYVNSDYKKETNSSGVKLSDYADIIYVDGIYGNDLNSGETEQSSVLTLEKAKTLITSDNTLIYVISEGTYSSSSAFKSLIHLSYKVTYAVKPDLYGKVILVLNNVAMSTQVMTKTNQFIGFIFQRSVTGDTRVYDYWYDSSTLDLVFYNCVFASGASAYVFYAGNSSGCTIKNLKYINCSFPNQFVGADSTTGPLRGEYINCSFKNVATFTTDSYNYFSSIYDSQYNITNDYNWKNAGTGVNPDGTVADLGVYGGQYAWGLWELYYIGIDTSIYVRPHQSLASTINVFQQDYHTEVPNYNDDITVAVSSTDFKGYGIEVSSIWDSTYPGWKAWNNAVVDGNDAWITTQNVPNGWMTFDYGSAVSLVGYGLRSRNHSYGIVAYPKDWTFYGSNDKTNWTTIDTQNGASTTAMGALQKYYIPTQNQTSYRYYKWDFTTSNGGVYISIAEIELYGLQDGGVSQRKTYITVPYHNDLASSITIKPHGIMSGRANISQVYFSILNSYVETRIHSNVISYITIPPHNKMSGIVDVIPPPVITVDTLPIQDAFVRDSVPRLNYGIEQEMVVGLSPSGERFKSLIKFDITGIPKDQKIKKALLNIYYDASAPERATIELYRVIESWTELGVTWANQPLVDEVIASFTTPQQSGYVQIDILGLFNKWYSGEYENDGLLLDSSDAFEIQRFYTKERAVNRPYLSVDYYDSKVKSVGYLELPGSITVVQHKQIEITSKITVVSKYKTEDFLSKIHVFNMDMIESFIEVNKPIMPGFITVRRSGQSEVPSTISVRINQISEFESYVVASRPFLNSAVTVRVSRSSEIPTIISVRVKDKSEIVGNITSSRPFLNSFISTFKTESVVSNILIVRPEDKSISSTISVRRSDSKDISTLINVWNKSDLPSEIFVISGYLKSTITIPYREKIDFKSKITVSTKYASDLFTYLEVCRFSTIHSEITVLSTGQNSGFVIII